MVEVPTLEETKEGKLRGGFSLIATPDLTRSSLHNENCNCNCSCPPPDTNTNCNCSCTTTQPPTVSSTPTSSGSSTNLSFGGSWLF
ncbi:MAG: hypothetical protein RR280_10340 [Bacteroidaceae bacterium]